MLTRIDKSGERIELTQAEIDARQAEIDNYVEPIPQSVELLQAKLAIDELELNDSIDAVIDGLPGKQKREAKRRWNHSQTVKRDNPMLIQILMGAGLIDSEIDDLFILAASL